MKPLTPAEKDVFAAIFLPPLALGPWLLGAGDVIHFLHELLNTLFS